MPPRRCSASAARDLSDMENDEYDDDEEEEQLVLRCLSCGEDFDPDDVGTCRECYEEANDTEDELRGQINELKSKVSFLKLVSPADPSFPSNPNAPAADVVLVPSGDVSAPPDACVPAHRTVLISRSPVFKAMLENDMEESRTGTIKITDVTYDVLCAFVNYLYTAEACLTDQLACNLLVLGEKYQVEHLKGYCERFLISRLNWEKSVASYAFAYHHNAKQLRDASMEVIMENMAMLCKNEAYAELVERDPHLVVVMYETYIGRRANTGAAITNLLGGDSVGN